MQFSPIGFSLVALDGSFLRVNPALCDFLGREPEELLGGAWQEVTHPEDLAADEQLAAEVLAGERDGYRMLKRFVRPDGTVLWGDLAVGSVRGVDGAVQCFIGQVVDVTRQHTAQQALTRSQEQYRLLAENASDLVFRCTAGMDWQWVSPSAQQVLGWNPDDLVGQSVVEIVHPDDVALVLDAGRRSEAGEPVTCRARLRRRGGAWRRMSITARPMFDRDGRLLGRVGSARAVDAEQATRAALMEHYDFLRLVIDSELDPRAFVSPVRDSAGTIVDLRYEDVNRAALQQMHLDRADLVGTTMLALDPLQRSSGLFERYVQAWESGEAVEVSDFPVASPEHTSWLDVSAVRVGDRLSITWRDVSERHAQQAALAASEQRYRLLTEHSSDIVAQADEHGVLRWVSDSVRDRLGWEPADLIGVPISNLVEPEYVPVLRIAHHGLHHGEAQHVRLPIRHHDGSGRWFDILIKPQRDPDGTVVGRISSWRDVHDEHLAQQQLRQSQAQYRLIAENAAEVVLLLDRAGHVTWLSPSVERLTGWAQRDLSGDQGWDLVHDADRTAVRAIISAVADGTDSGGTAARFRTPSGGYEYWHLDVRRISDTPGSAMVVTMRNVNEEFRAQQEARAQNARRRAVLDSMLDPHVLLEAVRDETGDIVDFMYADANDAACDYMRMSRDELIGATLIGLLPGHRGSDLFARYVHTVESGMPLIIDDYEYPHDIIAEPRHYDMRAVKINDGLSFTWRDITDRSVLAQQLAHSEERFRLIATNTSDIIVVADPTGALEWVSPSLTAVLGWTPAQWIGHRPDEFLHPDDLAHARQTRTTVAGGNPSTVRARLRDVNGGYHWMESRGAPLTDAQGNVVGVTAAITIIDDRVAWEETLKHRASHDPLTGLLTRDEAYRRLGAMLSHSPRTGTKTYLAFIDLDDLKTVNDTLGHLAGDELLRITAQRIRTLLRDGDHVARIGGDEMLLILTGVQNTDSAVSLMTRLLATVNAPHEFRAGKTLTPRMSIGLTEIIPNDDIDDAVQRGDQAMYQAKAAGGNQIRVAPDPGADR